MNAIKLPYGDYSLTSLKYSSLCRLQGKCQCGNEPDSTWDVVLSHFSRGTLVGTVCPKCGAQHVLLNASAPPPICFKMMGDDETMKLFAGALKKAYDAHPDLKPADLELTLPEGDPPPATPQ